MTFYPFTSGSGNGFQQKLDNYPLFVNFYPKDLSKDFMLSSTIKKLKYQNNDPTITNGNKRGLFTQNIQGQLNIGNRKHPIIIIPDIGACKIFAKWAKKTTQSIKKLDTFQTFQTTDQWSCRDTETNWVPLWYPDNQTNLTKYCWKDNIQVSYNSTDNTIINSDGLSSNTFEMGSIQFEGSIYNTLIKSLQSIGYTSGIDLFGGQYDFRTICSIDSLIEFTMSLTTLIENICQSSGYPVILLGHGIGSVLTNYFLVNSEKKWKDNNIKCLCSLNGSFGGSPKALRVLLSGENLIDPAESLIIRDATLNFSGLHLLLPNPLVYTDKSLIFYKQITYYAKDIPKLLTMISSIVNNNNDTVNIYKNIVAGISSKSIEAPEVTCYIFAGVDVPTESNYNYSNSINTEPIKNHPYYSVSGPNYENFQYPSLYTGDGTIPDFALKIPLKWTNSQNEPIIYKFYSGAEHCKILMMSEPIQDLISIIHKLNNNN